MSGFGLSSGDGGVPLGRRSDHPDARLPARLHVEPVEFVEQLVAAGLPQRQALAVLDEAVRLGERAEQVEIGRGGEQPVER